jgi:iron complex outermembrane receptor protein
MQGFRTFLSFLLCWGLSAPPARAGEPTGETDKDLKDLSIEELMELEVSIATRTEESLSTVPGAVYVLTGDEIRRAGHTSIPEALRMVPGFYVSHWFSQAWDVTARGFGPGIALTSAAFLNQLIVMIDGVVVYTPLFAGTWWDIQGLDMNDIERIEVMRGPGGSLWGTNATHGVVHIITKDSSATLGPRLSLRAGGNSDHVGVALGERIGENGSLRVWGAESWNDGLDRAFLDFDTDWRTETGGFRTDWKLGERNLTVWSRLYRNENHAYGFGADPINDTIPIVDQKRGYQIYAALTNPEDSDRLQAWYSADLQHQPTFVDISIRTFDLEYQRQFALCENNSLDMGAGYRLVSSELEGADPRILDFDPHSVQQDIFRLFAIDRLALPGLSSEVLLGCTLEHNDFTDFEAQPTLRLTWNACDSLTAWAAVSRAVRTPSLEERTAVAGEVFTGDPTMNLVGSDSFRTEKLWAYEAGVRTLVSSRASADLALFWNEYDDLQFIDFDATSNNLFFSNGAEGTSYGAELALDVRPTERWTLRSAYSFSHGTYEAKVDGSDLGNEDYYPEQQFNLRSYFDLGANWEADAAVYMVDGMGSDFGRAEYWRVDARLGWRPTSELDLYVGAQSLNDASHSEFGRFNTIRRAAFVGLNWRPGAPAPAP